MGAKALKWVRGFGELVRNIARPHTLCSRLERSPWQRAVAEGFGAHKEGCQTVRIILHHLVRAVLRVWQTAAHGLAGRPSPSR